MSNNDRTITIDYLNERLDKLDANIDQRVKREVWACVKRILTIAGIANALILLGVVTYVIIEIPNKAVDMAMRKLSKDISLRVATLQSEVDAAFKLVGQIEENLPKIKQDIEKIGADLLIIQNASGDDLKRAAALLELIKTPRLVDFTDTQADILTLRRNITELTQQVNNAFSGNRTLTSLRAKEISIVDNKDSTRLLFSTFKEEGLPNISLYDEQKKKRVQLYENDSGYAGIGLFDREGTCRVTMTTNPQDGLPSIYLTDIQNKKRVQLYENDSGYAGIGVFDKEGTQRITMITEPNGLPDISLTDAQNKKRVQLYEIDSGYAGIVLYDREGTCRVTMNTKPNGLPSIYLTDIQNKKRVQLYENDSGYAGIGLFDKEGTQRVIMTTNPQDGLPNIQLANTAGKVIYSMPNN